ncbi:MAG: hypothetical protein HQK55_07825, partial [Deltaproteobacteria bacterium]|nr:hypothetical protein [Deltaproteobacteria bacterium]
VVLAITTYLGFKHVRHQSLAFLAGGMLIPSLVTSAWASETNNTRYTINWSGRLRRFSPLFFLGLIVIFGGRFILAEPLTLQTPSRGQIEAPDEHYYPVAAMEFIKTHGLTGRLAPEFSWGEYLIWHLYPKVRVAMDGRYETVYPDYFGLEYFDFIEGRPGWEKFLAKYPTEMVLVPINRPIRLILKYQPDWREILTADGCALLVNRRLSQNPKSTN